MVRGTIKIITNKINGLGEAAFLLAIFSFFSLILALLRDRLLAHIFGAGLELDIYYAGFKVPDLIFVTVASLVSVSALVPLFARKETEGEKHLKDATDSIFTIFAVTIFIFCAIAYFVIPNITYLFFSGLNEYAIEKVILLSRVLLLSPLLLGFSNFFGSIVQYEKRFILYSLSPLFYNLGIILGIVFFNKEIGITSAVVGVVFGALIHLLLQGVFVFYSKLRPAFTFKIKWHDVWETTRISVPRTLALSITSFVGFVFAVLASRMGVGSISIFNFSWNLQSAPLSLIGVSFSLAAFPALAISYAKKDMSDVVLKISEGIRNIIFWSLPLTALILVLRAHITRVVLGSGSFDWFATRLVAASLAIFVLSTVFQSLTLFLSRSHYALGKTTWPLLGNIFGGSVSIGLAYLFHKNFEFFRGFFDFIADLLNVPDISHNVLLLPIAYSIGSAISFLILFYALGGDLVSNVWNLIKKSIAKSLIAFFTCLFGTYIALIVFNDYFSLDYFIGVFGHGLTAGIFGIIMTILVMDLLKSSEYQSVRDRLTHRYIKKEN